MNDADLIKYFDSKFDGIEKLFEAKISGIEEACKLKCDNRPDLEPRIRSLERWRAYILGACAVISIMISLLVKGAVTWK